MESASSENRRLMAMLLLGILALAAGLALARAWLPEWQDGTWLPERAFVERYRELARQAGIRLAPGEPRVTLAVSEEPGGDYEVWETLPEARPGLPPTPVRVSVLHRGSLPGRDQTKGFEVRFTPEGRPVAVRWSLSGWEIVTPTTEAPVPVELEKELTGILLGPDERLGAEHRGSLSGSPVVYYDLAGTPVPEHIFVLTPPGGKIQAQRRLGDAARSLAETQDFWADLIFRAIPIMIAFLAVVGLFFVLLSKGRIDLINGALAGAVTFAASAATLATDWSPGGLFDALLPALWVFLIWSAGESFLRSIDPGFTTSLDALRAGRLGPRGGRSLLYGVALGAVLAGVKLVLQAASMAAPGAWPGAGVALPVFSTSQSPLGDGIALAAAVMFVLAIVLRLLDRRWAPVAAALAGALFFPVLRLHPTWAGFIASFVLFGGLVWVYRRFGLTALLTACVVAFLLPAAAFSALHADWLPVALVASAGLPAGFLVLGFVGLRRPERVELGRLAPPRFMRRLDEERRLKYEMDLLARMQLGLLPADVPAVPGWDIAARSLLATEAGGDLYDFLLDDAGQLWIAAGDVAGHGYSCSIVQAMTTAALTSLIGPGKSPSEVLQGVDRVIRRGGSHRNFTSLTLLRLDPETGEAVLANAGHPYPLALAEGEVEELQIPGLPLGQGPRRQYRDVELQIPPGGALVLCSDGLFEAVNWEAAPYGFDRPREVLRTLETRPAAEILEILLADWRRHVSAEAPPDDTTVVVIKRAAAFDRSLAVT